MKKGTAFFFLSILILFLLFLSSDFALAKKCTTDAECAPAKCVEGECVRALEIVYPEIPGVVTPKTVAAGLPTYVNYIFQLAVIIIGLIIFAILIYNGVIYLTSTGDPVKMADARAGIVAGFLGAIILLSAFLIFNTINPQLTILKIEKIPPLRPIIFPGIYICSYKIDKDEIDSILEKYFFGTDKEREEAVKKLKELMWKEKEGKACLKLNYSGNFKDFTVKKGGNTFFVIPFEDKKYDPETKETKIKYVSEYGLVLHQKDNFGGNCQIFLFKDNQIYQEEDKKNYVSVRGDFGGLKFEARSFTLFKKPVPEPYSDARGVILYSCYEYNEGFKEGDECIKDPKVTAISKPFAPDKIVGDPKKNFQDMKMFEKSHLGKLVKNTRSVKIEPKGSFLALIFDEDNFWNNSEKCEVISSNVVDLTPRPIGRCGHCIISFWSWFDPRTWGKECYPCIQSMIVIKGQTL